MLTFPATYGAGPIGTAAYTAPVRAPMQNLILLSPAASDAAVLSASAQAAGLPVSNLQTIQPAQKWQAAGTAASITITATTPFVATALALVGHNFSADALLRLRAAAVQGNVVANPDLDTGWQGAWPLFGKPPVTNWPNWLSLLTWSNTSAFQFWQLDIVDPGNTVGYLEAGRLALGVPWQPSLNFDVAGSPLGFDQLDVQSKTAWGRTFTDARATSAARTFNIQITAVDRREVTAGLVEIQRLRGLWGDVICCLDPAEPSDFHLFSMQGYFVPKPDYPIVPQYTENGVMFTAKLQLAEFL
ncbi:hypothetical protein [Nitrobacter sp.]|uniref:hypothetical protein n=1 Tax=Nitrobacter sp. TaxID=29420 RepID=UPI0029CAC03C|nr:hypothetical protein [Nitrobacter sp.]